MGPDRWTPTLRLNAAAIRIARVLYDCRCDLYGGPRDWDRVPPGLQQHLLGMALVMVEATRPEDTPPVPVAEKPRLQLVARR